jgi:hypothetical protein
VNFAADAAKLDLAATRDNRGPRSVHGSHDMSQKIITADVMLADDACALNSLQHRQGLGDPLHDKSGIL